MSKQSVFTLTAKERSTLLAKKRAEKLSKRVRDRIDILLLADHGRSNTDIGRILGVTLDTVWRVKKRSEEEGAEAAIGERERPGQPKKYDTTVETELTAIACSDAPEGAKRWTIELLAQKLRSAVDGCDTMNRETVRLMLKKMHVSLG